VTNLSFDRFLTNDEAVIGLVDSSLKVVCYLGSIDYSLSRGND